MALPDARLTIQDGALGTLPANVSGASAMLGVMSGGTHLLNTVVGYGNLNTMKANAGVGPALEAAALKFALGAGPVYLVPVTPSTAGTLSSVTHTGPGTGTVTVAAAPDRQLRVKIITGGALTVATFQVAIGTGDYGPVITTGAGPYQYRVPGAPLVVLQFAAGTYVGNDIYTIAVDGTVTLTGSGPNTVTVASASPLDKYDVRLKIATSGGLGAGAFTYSLDGNNTVSAVIAIPSGAGRYAIPGTGVVLTFAGTFTRDDGYNFTTTPASYSTSDVNTAMTVLLADPATWDHVHVVGEPTNAAGAATLAAVMDVHMTAAEAAFRYAGAIVECPQAEGDSAIKTAFASFQSRRVLVGVGDADVVSPVSGRKHRRNSAWVIAARISDVIESQDPAAVADGALSGVTGLYRNEEATPGLDEARFSTLRSYTGVSGYYITNARMMAPGGSDYTYVTNRRVMDTACRIARQAAVKYINGKVRVDSKTGFIAEVFAQQVEADIEGQLRAGLVSPGLAVDVDVTVKRDEAVLTTYAMPMTVRVLPFGYSKFVEVDIGFVNPALQVAA